jgi:hypothetical protein
VEVDPTSKAAHDQALGPIHNQNRARERERIGAMPRGAGGGRVGHPTGSGPPMTHPCYSARSNVRIEIIRCPVVPATKGSAVSVSLLPLISIV